MFNYDECATIFEMFWKSADRIVQNTFIKSLVDVKAKDRCTTNEPENSRRSNSRIFKLKKEGVAIQVCKDMFLSTLGIGSQRLNVALLSSDDSHIGIDRKMTKSRNPRPSRGFNWTAHDLDLLSDFLKKIPKAPGHYCRKDSNKIYLSKVVPTLRKLYEIYKSRCIALHSSQFSYWKFSEYFHENRFSIFKRKKDTCNTCVGYDEGNVTREVFNQHQKRKNEGFKLKDLDKAAADGKTTFVITADTEALLLAPYNRANVMFFHSKLNIHNFTFYDLKTKVVLNYVWPEVSGDIEAPNFTTCYIDYLTNVLENNPSCSQIIIWSDGCT